MTDKQVQAIRGRLATLSETQVLVETTGGGRQESAGMREECLPGDKGGAPAAYAKKNYDETPQLAKELAEAR